jgi:hypothetical protein
MNRRELFKTIAGVAAAVGATGLTGGAAVPTRRYGAVTIERWNQLAAQGVYLHVFHEGCDITTRCSFADDTNEGVADLVIWNADGKKYGSYGRKEVVYGVTIREGAALS